MIELIQAIGVIFASTITAIVKAEGDDDKINEALMYGQEELKRIVDNRRFGRKL